MRVAGSELRVTRYELRAAFVSCWWLVVSCQLSMVWGYLSGVRGHSSFVNARFLRSVFLIPIQQPLSAFPTGYETVSTQSSSLSPFHALRYALCALLSQSAIGSSRNPNSKFQNPKSIISVFPSPSGTGHNRTAPPQLRRQSGDPRWSSCDRCRSWTSGVP